MKKKNMKVLSVCSLASLVISGSVISTTGVKAADTNTTTRLGGSDRYETAVKISQNGWKSGSDYVVLANGQGFADALCANPIAKSKNAPILLTESTSLNSSTLAELKRLNAKHVIIVGGTGVVPTAIENTIKTQLNADVTRYGGADRYETSVKIAKSLGNTSKIVLASGRDFADALSAAPAASIEGIPVVLTQPDQLPAGTSDYIKGNSNLTKTYVIGGTGSVSASLYNTLKNPERFGGIDRFETNAKVIDGFKDDFDFNNIYVALGKGPIGNEFADSLTGGALASKNKNALVITSSPISSYTTGILKDKLTTSSTLTILGGTGNITDTMISTLKDAITKSPSTGGGGGSSTPANYAPTPSASDNYLVNVSPEDVPSKVDDLNTKITNDSNLGKYFKADADFVDGALVLNTNTTKATTNTIQELFNDADSSDPAIIASKLDSAINAADGKLSLVLNSGNEPIKQVLANQKKNNDTFKNSKYAAYVYDNGNIDTTQLSQDIVDKKIKYSDYTDFTSKLSDAIVQSIGDKANENAPALSTSLGNVYKVQQDNTIVYNTAWTMKQNIENVLEDVSSSTKLTGTYYLYNSLGKYAKVVINPAK
ncbi:cell wall-binding repeat-containing protein [Clostridium tyrobutyricum]|uniref:cell wall-binding repeat-containing protein n=1 Tax=Clostridium tyrobutyricum TaxID=1519 RepID=UPI001C38A0C6|nr:cell wall-binding repeat-containing protein [Clostridium tyrobutyricum]MBV4432337.1 cell wall-binding repeat-containing protein [Clostridium tyrobutyricum]